MSDIEFQARVRIEGEAVTEAKAFVFRIDPEAENATEEIILSFSAKELRDCGMISGTTKNTTLLYKGRIKVDADGEWGEILIDLSLSRCEP